MAKPRDVERDSGAVIEGRVPRPVPSRMTGARGRALVLLAGVVGLAGLLIWGLGSSNAESGAADVLRRSRAALSEPVFDAAVSGDRVDVPAQPQADPEPLSSDAFRDASRNATGVDAVRTLTGRVVRASDGTPLEGVIVSTAVRANGTLDERLRHALEADGMIRFDADSLVTQTVEARTDAEGRFTLAGVPVSVDGVQVRSDDGWPERSMPFPLPDSDGDVTGMELIFDSGFTLHGMVRNGHGMPLGAATARLGPMVPVVTDAAGRFTFCDIAPAPGTLTVECSADLPLHLRDSRPVPVPGDCRQIATIDLVLLGSGAIEGRVTGVQATPVPDVVVKLVVRPTSRHGELALDHLRAETDADGNYRIEHVPAGDWLVEAGDAGDGRQRATLSMLIHAGVLDDGDLASLSENGPASQFASRWIRSVPVREGEVTRLDIALDAGASIEGRVTDAYGAPVANAVLAPVRRERWPANPTPRAVVSDDGTRRVTTADGETVLATRGDLVTADDDGRYRIELVADGELLLTASDPNGWLLSDSRLLNIAGTGLHVDFALAEGLVASGRVTDASGAPLEGAAVELLAALAPALAEPARVSTDADGRFRAGGLLPDLHALTIDHSGCITLHDTAQPGGPERTYVLQPAPVLHALVVDARTGTPLLAFEVGLHQGGMLTTHGTEEHADGRFTRDVQSDGPVTFTIFAAGHSSTTLTVLHVSDTSPSEPAVFRLDPQP